MKRNIDTTIQFSGLKSGLYDYHYVLDGQFFEVFENENIHDGNVVFEVQLEKKERMLLINFVFHGEIVTTCDRCLGALTVPVSGEETLCVKFSDSESSDDENIAILPEKAYQIDLAQWMYEYVAVAIPMQCLHPDDEQGNPTCDPEMLKYISAETLEEASGEQDDREIDPRWEALKKLK